MILLHQLPLSSGAISRRCEDIKLFHFVTSRVLVLGGVKIYLLCPISCFERGLSCRVNQIARRREGMSNLGGAT